MKEIQLTKGKVALVDDLVYDNLINYRWCMTGDYAYNSKLGTMHRYLMNQPYQRGKKGASKGDIQVDHINGNKQDNRIENLMVLTQKEHVEIIPNLVKENNDLKNKVKELEIEIKRLRGGV